MRSGSREPIRLTHAFAASAERVFDAWVSPDKVARWLLPDAVQKVTRVELGARVGGSIRAVSYCAGRTVEHTVEYQEIQRPHRLSFTIRNSASAETERVTVRIEPRGTGCFLTLTSGIEPAPLQALAPFAASEAYRAKRVVRPRWPTLEVKAALSLGLHLAMLPVLLVVLRAPVPPPGTGDLGSVAMVTVDLGATEGVTLPQPSSGPAVMASSKANVAKAEPLPPPPPAAHAETRTALPIPPSRTTHHASGLADNEGTAAGAGLPALNALGSRARATNGPDPATSVGGGTGEDGEMLHLRTRAASAQVGQPRVEADCVGTVSLSPDAINGTYYGVAKVSAQARFFRDRHGKPWIRFTLWPGAPWNLPVTIAGSEMRWTGVNGIVYALRPAGENHLTGFAGFNNDSYAKLDFACASTDADRF